MDNKSITYRVTVGNISGLLLFILAFYLYFNPGEEGWGILVAWYLFGLSVLFLVIDMVMQQLIRKYLYINLIGLVLTGALVWWFLVNIYLPTR